MNHEEALQQMAAERYLLNELAPEAREAFEEHFFECADCALDLRAGAAFVELAKVQLPNLLENEPAPHIIGTRPLFNWRFWEFAWLRPAFAAPVFATLLLIVGYQNLVTVPGLRAAATEPRLTPWEPLHGATRGTNRVLTADRQHGLALPVDLPAPPSPGAYSAYNFELRNPQGKLVWTTKLAAPAENDAQRFSLFLPGGALENGAWSLTIAGISAQGDRTAFAPYSFDLHLND